MKRKQKNISAILMALTLIVSGVGQVPAGYGFISAEGSSDATDIAFEVNSDVTMNISKDFQDEPYNISTEDTAEYSFDAATGTLTISGEGACDPYSTVKSSCKSIVKNIVFEGISMLPSGCLSGFNNLETVSLPSTLKIIDNSVFCYLNSLESLTIPSSVEYFGLCSIEHNDKLKTLKIDGNKIILNNNAISNNKSLEKIVFGSGINFSDGNIVNYCKNLSSLVFESGDSFTDRQIGDYAFSSSSTYNLSVVFPDDLTRIGENALAYKTFDKIELPNNLSEIASNAFSGISASEIIINHADIIKSKAFSDIQKCDSISLKNIKEIDQYAFSSSNITDLDLSLCSDVKIGDYAFQCSKLETVVFPSSVASLGNGIFQYSSSLKAVVIPETIKDIPEDIFFGCTNFTIYSVKGSDAENLAKKLNVTFDDIKNAPVIQTPAVTEATSTTAASASTTKATTASSKVTTAATTKATTASSKVTAAATTKATTASSKVTAAATTKATTASSKVTTAVTTKATTASSKVTTAVTTKATTASSVKKSEYIRIGDINDDGDTDITDLTLLSMYLLDKVINTSNHPEADIDQDGVVDIADLAKLKQYVSKDSAVKELGTIKRK